MKVRRPPLLFDREDFELVELVNEFTSDSSQRSRPSRFRRLFDADLHPRGVKELAAPRQLRIAYAVVQLLESLEQNSPQERLAALRTLRDEVLHNSSGSLRINTARVLIEIMKRLIRERDNYWLQVELAHDFFAASSGRPSSVREQLRNYHLVEMSERWDQVAFDHHVHDANTKGRKAPAHLIMDAWIKGIRELTVIYYNFVTPQAVDELMQAAELMDIEVQAGIEISVPFRGKQVELIWTPGGFGDRHQFLAFLERPLARAFMDEGRKAALPQKNYVLELLRCFNEEHLETFRHDCGIDMPALDPAAFLDFVGVGQPSPVHLADYIHHLVLPRLREGVDSLRRRRSQSDDADERTEILEQLRALNALLPETIRERYLTPARSFETASGSAANGFDGVPRMRNLSLSELIEELAGLSASYSLTLTLGNLTDADVLELIYQAGGAITHLEVFNLKDYKRKTNPHASGISEIRRIVNGGSPVACKRLIRRVYEAVQQGAAPDRIERLEKLRELLLDIPRFVTFYRDNWLKSRIGTDSTGRSRTLHGMGLVISDTLPGRSQRKLIDETTTRERIPMQTEVVLQTTWLPRDSQMSWLNWLYGACRDLPGLRSLGYVRRDTYRVQANTTHPDPKGNIATLGGREEDPDNGFRLDDEERAQQPPRTQWRLLSSRWRNLLKVAAGFLPAFLTFYLTKQWWILAYFGAVIWFGITGVRNVIQAIVGGGGLLRSSLVRWNDLVSWQRVCDSLFYTGFSVPLLDWLIKTVLLDRGLGITTSTSPVLLYALMAVANGVYLATHNTVRGLPKAAVFGNFFRSILSIPVAIALNLALAKLLQSSGHSEAGANAMLQTWAAVIGKAASDCVAGFIEGTADRSANMRTRYSDYRQKIVQLLDIHGQLEVMFPDKSVLDLLESPAKLFKAVRKQAPALERRLIINALDLLYFWMYQPRARVVFWKLLASMEPEERQVVVCFQSVLERKKAISKMLLDELVGKDFSRTLAFFLDSSPAYLRELNKLPKS